MKALSSLPAGTLEPIRLSPLAAKPLVSILVGNYNYAGYIGQGIESVLRQSYSNWELIICDDGSTDASVEVIESYARACGKIRLIQKANGGHTSALNAAFAAARGELICLLDSDDLYLPSKVERVVEAALEAQEAGLIVHRVIRVNQDRKREGVWPLSDLPKGWFGAGLLSTAGVLPYLPPTSGLNLRREVAEILFPISTEPPLHMCPDQVIMRLAPLVTCLASVPEPLAEYRLHTSNTYSRQQMTAASVARELSLARALWQEQRRFLAQHYSGLEGQLVSIEDSPYVRQLEYLETRLGSGTDAQAKHAAYIAACERHNEKKWIRFWRWSIFLPGPLFRSVVGLLLGQNFLKQLAARIKRLG